jgi:hypothetical protein
MLRVLVVLLPVLAGCVGQATACPAVGYGVSLTVQLADDWPSGVDREVSVDCPEDESCGRIIALPVDEPPARQPATAPVRDGAAAFSLSVVVEEVAVTVREAGADVVSVRVEPDWVRVGGSKDCGGPMHAEVVVPAP